MKQEIPEIWPTRRAADEARHLASCLVCREHLRPASDQKLYAVKNSRTRQFVHVLVNGESLESKLGWSREEILYSFLLEDGAPKGPPMNEEVKVKLREANKKRREEKKLKRQVRANTPARLVAGDQGKEGQKMPTKKKLKASKAGKSKKPARTSGGLESQLPNEFVRRYKGKDYKIEKIADGWQVNGSKTMTIHEAKCFILAQHGSPDKKWTTSIFFKAAAA